MPLPIDIGDFLARHWQREPLLIRDALPGFSPPLSANELAGLALEAEVESRIVEEDKGKWRVSHGPFTEADFQRPPPWSLLVQAVDDYVPEVADLRRLVDFIPDWRADDVMVSYATDGGSVGPHFDHYDVFLLQGEGQRHWRLGQHCDGQSPLIPGTELRILDKFEQTRDYLLNPGDILYVPPGVAHWGVARGECTTFSIGFRAPRRGEMLARLADAALEHNDPDHFFSDPGRAPATRPGELSTADLALARVQALALLESTASPRWFGELVTEPRYPAEGEDASAETIEALLHGEGELHRTPGARIAWLEQGGRLYVFANGASYETETTCRPQIIALCNNGHLTVPAPDGNRAALANLLQFLLESGGVHVE
ncbi:cupin domain-containing protein [Parahaliea mediterranea]|uniref:Cupin domain-containing protein n=1 Tax=Parahaliea mediterranea TaxID=651086 RepID=A0A939DJ69_9GAMM|nr:cupin domain-containing protein [Parahaliea mediterranea]MBN7798806.1 cupin domain-containing protein [Parahaliea mediterranea]